MISYNKGSLFKAPVGTILAHACNCKGVWGSGIAVEFKKRFPDVFQEYADDCGRFGDQLAGHAKVYRAKDYDVACLFTSRGFGEQRDDAFKILEYTQTAVDELIVYAKVVGREIDMPKINSGRFAVPWEKTAELLNTTFGNRRIHVWEGE